MRSLADMGVAGRVVGWLRREGHDAVHLRDQGLHRLPDPEIFLKAAREERIVLTFDLDFGEISSPLQVPPGVYDLEFHGHDVSADKPSTPAAATIQTPELMAGERYLAIATGYLSTSPGFWLTQKGIQRKRESPIRTLSLIRSRCRTYATSAEPSSSSV